MDSLFTFIHSHMSCCLNCGAFSVNIHLLCTPCANTLGRLAQTNSAVKMPPMLLRAFYTWYPGQSDLLSKLILALKGQGLKEPWAYYAQLFVNKNFTEISRHQRIIIVPAPPKKQGVQDHAYFWAQGLANASGAEIFPFLKKVSSGHQRGADRGDRALVEMEVTENYSKAVDFSSKTLWIFADDVLTTGATARAAHKALGCPDNFEVWTLAHRSLSCGASKDLL